MPTRRILVLAIGAIVPLLLLPLAVMGSTALAPSAILTSSGFEDASFAAGGWALDVAGAGSAASLVTSPVAAGAKAARFTTTTQKNGEHAFAERGFAWPQSNAVVARARVLPQIKGIQFFSKVLSLETHGPHNWMPRAAFGLGPSTFRVIYTTRAGALRSVDLGRPYASDRWYELSISVDYRGKNPVMRFAIDGHEVYLVNDSTGGNHTDRPAAVRVGFGPGAWGENAGSVVVDEVRVQDGGSQPAPPDANPTATPTATPQPPTATATATEPPATPTATDPPGDAPDATAEPPTATSVPPTATTVPDPPAPAPATATPAPTSGAPVEGQPCPTWVHDRHVTTGPDGRSYPTWHPPVDPEYGCYFGHEHGADPRTSRADSSLPAFGYAAAQVGMTEPHVGFKVFVLNAGDTFEGSVSRADHRIVFHMGTSGVKRYTEQFHSVEYDYVAHDGTGRYAHVYGMADTGHLGGSTCDNPRKGGRDFSTLGCADTYEIWNGIKLQIIHPDDPYTGVTETRATIMFSTAAFDPVTTRDPADNDRLVYTQQVKGDPNVDPLSPDAEYLGCQREAYFGPSYFHNAGQPTEYWTDVHGHVQPGPGPGLIKQEISAVDSTNNEQFKFRQDFCGHGIHAPN